MHQRKFDDKTNERFRFACKRARFERLKSFWQRAHAANNILFLIRRSDPKKLFADVVSVDRTSGHFH